jgi:hypothetical protein
MTVDNRSIAFEAQKHRNVEHPPTRVGFDLWVVLLASWFVFGVYLDGWAHSHLPESLESFLTPWHGVLYTGMLSVGFLLVATQMRNVSKGYAWRSALPMGYGLSLFGFLAFAGAGIFDFAWHEVFGSEADIEALLSPAHLLLAISGFIVVTGPLRSAWKERQRQGWGQMFPVVLSATLAVSVLTFFTEYVHFYNTPNVLIINPGVAQTLIELEDPRFLPNVYGVLSAVIPSLLLIGTLLFLLSRWNLPFGTMTVVIGVNSALMFFMSWGEVNRFPGLLIGMFISGILADFLWSQLKRFKDRQNALRLFAFGVPFMMVLLYMVILNQSALAQVGEGLWWKIHMWLGVPFVAGLGGVLLSILQMSSSDADRTV